MQQTELIISTKGRNFYSITERIDRYIATTKISIGLCNIFIKHTSASLIVSENADPLVCEDLECFMQKLVPDDIKLYQHNAEGEDDMPSHVRSVLTCSSLNIPIVKNRLNLGTWQGVFLWEHRYKPQERHIIVTCY